MLINALVPLSQIVVIVVLVVGVIALRRCWNNRANTLFAVMVTCTIGLRVMDELSNALFGVDILSTQANWIVRGCMLAAVTLFLLRSEQMHRAAQIETGKQKELQADNERLRQAALVSLREREKYLEFIRAMDQQNHAHDWTTMKPLGMLATVYQVKHE